VDVKYFYHFDVQVTAFLLKEKKIKEEQYASQLNDGLPLSTAIKCHCCAKLVEIGNHEITCGTCLKEGKGKVKFESYFYDVDCFYK
jgi:hypothetical protein